MGRRHIPSAPAALPQAIDVARGAQRFADFGRCCWARAVGEGRPLRRDWVSDAICLHLQALADGRTQRLAIEVPPGSGKSTWGSVLYPAYELLRRPGIDVLSLSGSAAVASRDASACRDVVSSHEYAALQRAAAVRYGTPQRWQIRQDSEAKNNWRTPSGGGRRSLSADAGLTGLRGDLTISDDLVDVRAAYSGSVEMARRVAWYRDVFSTRENVGARALNIGHRVHAKDVNGWLWQNEADRWTVLRIPAEWEGDDSPNGLGWRDPRRTLGELVPRLDADTAKRLKLRMGAGWRAQYQQRPDAADGAIYHAAWFRYWTELPPRFDALILSVDTALRETRHSDRTSIQAWGFCGPDAYLLLERCGRYGVPEIVTTCRALAALTGAQGALIERSANGGEVIARLGEILPGVVGVEQFGERSSKVARAHSVTPRFESGNVWFPDGMTCSPFDGAPHEWVAPLIAEFVDFPAGSHDDRVDACNQALQWHANFDVW